WSTRFIMLIVSASLLPTAVMGIVFHGIHSLFVILASVISAVGTEFIFDKITHKPDTWKDGSAVVTGLLLALTLSPNAKLYLPILGSVFAILVVKCFFGGLGRNFLNPALAARCFLLISFGSDMTDFSVRNGVDAVSSATPTADLLAGKAVNVTRMFLGNTNGIIGTSVVALLVGGLFLWAMDIIHGQICFSVLIGFALFIGLFGGQGFDPAFILAHICGGGVVMGAFFMATDYTTSPVSKLGQLIYGILIGVLGGLFRLFGSAADSFSYSIIIANLFTPLIDMYIIPKPFAYRRKAIEARQALAEAGIESRSEEKKSFLGRIPKPVIALAVITLVSGLALSGVYTMTKDTIDEQKRIAKAMSYKAVCPDAEEFEFPEDVEAWLTENAGAVYGTDFGRCYINEAVIGKDAAGNNAGYVVSVTTADGNDGNISLSVGVDEDGTVNGIAFTELNETPGMGMLCGEPAFMGQFEGAAVDKFELLKSGGATADYEIDAISGSTVTSSAVVNAVNAGLDFINNVMKGGE
ncbi:MAG: RnfABCDGE type electron transport complex subunit D, partial [Lachnospiraceae bacterium]|nr:RnfABCDGE type electron transport complex subunit D [Lachnospiraceae bacterium]